VLSPCHVIQSNHIAAFALDLKSAYEGEHMIFGLLTLWSSVAPFESILVKKKRKKKVLPSFSPL
jgi:hypothetical protein